MYPQLKPSASPKEDAEQIRAAAQEETRDAVKAALLKYADEVEALAAKLQPGEHVSDLSGRDPKDGELKPKGLCDAVFFLDRIAGSGNVTVVPSARREALRYLRPLPDAQRFAMASQISRHADPNYLGVGMPQGLEMPWLQELHRIAEDQGRRLKYLFTADKRGIDANKPEHMHRWRCYKVAEDVWAVCYA